MRPRSIVMSCCLLLAAPAYASTPKAHDTAVSMLPATSSSMRNAGFWISRHPDPLKIILSPKDITAFNIHVQNDLKLTKDIFALLQDLKMEGLVGEFDRMVDGFIKKDLYTVSGIRDSQKLLDRARINMNTPGLVLGAAPRYGLVVHYANVRFLPTDEPLYESPGDIDFDQVQNSSLDAGTPVAVVHQSLDKRWYYVYSALSQGWVEADRIAAGDEPAVRNFVQDKHFAVSVAARGDVYLDTEMTKWHESLRMGTRLPLVKGEGGIWVVRVPVFGADHKLQIVDGYVRSRDFHQGYLPYTAANIITQAFVMLDRMYGWGGMYGEQDCSAFLDEIFATVGITFPRDSKDQALVGRAIAEFASEDKVPQRLKAFEGVLGGETILPMKGHIMLYLGQVDGRPYAIHSVWAYRVHEGDVDVPKVINKVTVSDLFLGEGSAKGSLLKRLTRIIRVQ